MQEAVKPPEAFRTISEASDELGVAPHVLRFWEGKFTHLRPLKRAGGRRFYRQQDMAILRGLKSLLQDDGYTIRGVQKLIKETGIQSVRDRASNAQVAGADYTAYEIEDTALPQSEYSAPALDVAALSELEKILARLQKTQKMLDEVLAQ